MTQSTTGSEDVYIYQSADPHTAIPDWLALCTAVSPEARSMACTILVLSKAALPPTRAEIAEALGVDLRTAQRWLAELRSAGILRERPAGRRVLCVFSRPCMGDRGVMGDTTITRHHDHPSPRSGDRSVTHDPPKSDRFLVQQDAPNDHFFENTISDRPVGVVVGNHDSEEDPTTNNGAALKTPLARWLKQQGVNAARQFDDPALDFATYVRFVTDKRVLGWDWRQIVSTLREAPLDPDPSLMELIEVIEPAMLDDQADDQASDDQATTEAARRAFSERCRQELIASANKRPSSYHGGKQ